MSEYRVLDLFSGLGGFSSSFAESNRWEVTRIDIDERFDVDLQADIMELSPSDLDADYDVILASPPCTQFSIAASSLERFIDGEPQTDDARDAVALVYHTIGLIKAISPEFWFLENPQGFLRQIIGHPDGRVTYCRYGEPYMKPTDLWGEHPTTFNYRSCSYGDGCHAYNTDHKKGGKGNVRTMFQQTASGKDPARRAKVPFELSDAIRSSCESALDGEAPRQTQITEVNR